ncbi:PAS domain S-box protein [Siminovitchia acidinfaciens]|uniref:HTH-type transcriptional regulatory protein TyrR n=1 Tax=Siminovitchia acidinfaciens TaxID=2321395 RepID=A0A429Y7C4_9BACI|nr:sigma 54-interacting transcriptional regulator [Siminovitchia acidinfaciens]RST77283.1 PAS domain S-box protein [Siminovitchia acidinfaciens]
MDSILLKGIINYSFDEIFIIDHKGVVSDVSPASADLYGVDSQDLIGQTVYDLEEKGILNPSVSIIVLKSKTIENRIQYTRTNKKVLVAAYPIFDKCGALANVLSFSRDITELEMLKEKNNQVAKTISLYEKELENLKKQKGLFYDHQEKLMNLVEKVADLDVTLLIRGETGVGKTRFAQVVHERSFRKNMPFIEVNCGAIPETLLESELFGYEEGAFTGAKTGGKKGYFELAHNGTILLDEISELPYHLQVKLLSVLQNRKITRLGSDKEVYVDCRIICATNRNLEDLVTKGQFREDLFFRINVINIDIPPLRERKNEIKTLIDVFTEELNLKHGLNKSFSEELKVWMSQQQWPGNIRELRNYIEKTMILSNNEIITLADSSFNDAEKQKQELTLSEYMEAIESEYINKMYKKYPSSIKLGKALGISQTTANRKIKQYVQKASNL